MPALSDLQKMPAMTSWQHTKTEFLSSRPDSNFRILALLKLSVVTATINNKPAVSMNDFAHSPFQFHKGA